MSCDALLNLQKQAAVSIVIVAGRASCVRPSLVLETNLAQQASSGTRLALVENVEQALPDMAGFLASIDKLPDASLLVVVDHRAGLLVVGSQSLLESSLVVVASLDQGLASDIIGHVRLGGVEDLVVRSAGRRVDETTSNSGNEEIIVNAELDSMLERELPRSKHLIKTLGLGDCARETIKDEAV